MDAGKSTLMGHLLYLLGNVNKRTMHKYEQESKKAGKASFAYAWVLDETGEERDRYTLSVKLQTNRWICMDREIHSCPPPTNARWRSTLAYCKCLPSFCHFLLCALVDNISRVTHLIQLLVLLVPVIITPHDFILHLI